MNKILSGPLHFLTVFFQRLFSIDWKTAGAELALLLAVVAKTIADLKGKDFGAFLTDITDPNGFLTDLAGLGLALRLTTSSNKKAIDNPQLPNIN